MPNSWWWFLVACAMASQAAEAHSSQASAPPNQCGEGKIYDITHKLVEGMPSFDSLKGTGVILTETKSSDSYSGNMTLGTHMGTHVDAPGHLFEELLRSGYDVDYLDLRTLNGPVLVVDAPRDRNITAEVLQSMNLPAGLKRVIFKTLNTDRALMKQRAFEPNYTGLTVDGAEWLVKNTQIKFIGIDYLSLAAKDDLVPVHKTLLILKDIIPVECLNLDEIIPGNYIVHCLPLRLPSAEGSPTRCILVQ